MVLDKASEFFLCIDNYLVKLVGTIFSIKFTLVCPDSMVK